MYVATSEGKGGVQANTIVPGLILTDASTRTPVRGRHRGPRPRHSDAVPRTTERRRGPRRFPGFGAVALHHRADDFDRRRDVRARRPGHRRLAARRPERVRAGLRMVIPAAGGMSAAVDVDRLTGDVAGHVGREKHCCAGHFVDMTSASHRDREAEPLLGARRRYLPDAFGQGDIGRQRVDPDAMRSELQCRGLGVVDDAGLGRRVGRVTRCGADALDRGDADDAARQFLLDEDSRPPAGCTGRRGAGWICTARPSRSRWCRGSRTRRLRRRC